MKLHTGIVLKNHTPQKHKLSIVDNTLGRIDTIIGNDLLARVRHGSLIQYYPHALGTMYKLSGVELLFMPFGRARENIFFLHHVLELCYHFFPQGYVDKNFFETLVFLIKQDENNLVQVEHKLLFLFRIFVMVGGVSETKEQDYQMFFRLALGPLDTLIQKEITQKECDMIRTIVFDCIAQHPYAKGFKTLTFLTESGIV